MENEPLYRLTSLRFFHEGGETAALSVDNLELRRGECVMVTGPNGSGKTTFLKVLNDLGTQAGRLYGKLEFMGRIVRDDQTGVDSQALRKASLYLHQHPYLVSGGVKRNMDFACKAKKIPPGDAERRSRAALELVGLDGLFPDRLRGLSGGESQRLALARAIAAGAEVLLLDEPTSSADAESGDMIVRALKSLAQGGTTILFSSHDTELLGPVAHRVLEFRQGRIVRDYRSEP